MNGNQIAIGPSSEMHLSAMMKPRLQIQGCRLEGCDEHAYELQMGLPQMHCPRKLGTDICTQL